MSGNETPCSGVISSAVLTIALAVAQARGYTVSACHSKRLAHRLQQDIKREWLGQERHLGGQGGGFVSRWSNGRRDNERNCLGCWTLLKLSYQSP